MKITNLRQVVDYQLCCGCGLCAYIDVENITMTDVPGSGRRPLLSNVKDRILHPFPLEMCPGAGLSRPSEMVNRPDINGSLARDWGPILEIWEGYAADPEIRFRASSGGALSAIALYCLEREDMHGVLHTSQDRTTPYNNKTIMSSSRSSILDAAGSRYSPASPCEGLLEVEKAPAPCVFIGKPCDVAAANNARRIKSELDEKLGLVMACFCAGTPSTDGTLEMLRQIGLDSPKDLVSLRYRGCGWPGKTRAEISILGRKMWHELSYQQSWGDILQKYRQWRCYICPDHTGEFADIAAGDPWYREIEEGAEGQSLLLARSTKGQKIIEKAIAAGYLVAQRVDGGLLPASQKNLLKARGRLWGQMIALKMMRAPFPHYRGFQIFSSWKDHLTKREKAQSIFGTMLRVYSKGLKQTCMPRSNCS